MAYKGKKTCKILKEIRKEIAKNNDIQYITSECKHQGDCAGTCPKCEAEVRYLESELEKRKNAGKTVVLAGVAAAMIFSSGCEDIFSSNTVDGDLQPPSQEESQPILTGAPVEYASSTPEEETQSEGEIAPPEESGEQSSEEISLPVFMGDIIAPEE